MLDLKFAEYLFGSWLAQELFVVEYYYFLAEVADGEAHF